MPLDIDQAYFIRSHGPAVEHLHRLNKNNERFLSGSAAIVRTNPAGGLPGAKETGI